MSEEFEELEQIPWAALAAGTPDPRWRLALMAAAGCAILVLLLVVGKVVLAGDGSGVDFPADAPTEVGGPVAAAAQPPAAVEPVDSGSPQAPSDVAVPPAAYSEADLMAISVDDEVRLAEMWAGWFVRDYLTIDANGEVADEVARLLSTELSPAETTTFVEWVDSFAVSTPTPGVYRVEVAYRLLVEGAAGFVRQPAAALAVELEVDLDGSARLRQLPEIVPLPVRRGVSMPDLTMDLPEAVTSAIREDTPPAAVSGGYEVDSVWRVVVTEEIAPGVTRPHLVVVDPG